MTLNQRKSELFALAAFSIAVAGCLPWDLMLSNNNNNDDGNHDKRSGVGIGDARDGGVMRGMRDEEDRRWWVRNVVRGGLVAFGGVLVGGWAVWS